MKEQAINQSNDSGWFKSSLLSPAIVGLIVGIIVLLGQGYLAPYVARGVKREESILEQKYKAYENAISIMHRYLASVDFKGETIPEWYMPPEKTRPTQVETNVAYALLAIYSKSNIIAEQFYNTFGSQTIKGEPSTVNSGNILKFVSAARKELGVDKKGFTGGKYHYIMPRPIGENGQKDKEPKDDPNNKQILKGLDMEKELIERLKDRLETSTGWMERIAENVEVTDGVAFDSLQESIKANKIVINEAKEAIVKMVR